MKKTYCGECGSLMVQTLVPAEEYSRYGMMGDKYHPYRKYNTENGKRQYVYEFSCPNKVWGAYIKHDRYYENNIVYKEKK
jgi:hypothetical protein